MCRNFQGVGAVNISKTNHFKLPESGIRFSDFTIFGHL